MKRPSTPGTWGVGPGRSPGTAATEQPHASDPAGRPSRTSSTPAPSQRTASRRAPDADLPSCRTAANRVAAALGARVMGQADTVALRSGQVIYAPRCTEFVYFPQTTLVSLRAVIGHGEAAVTGLVGSEGLIGGPGLPEELGGIEAVVAIAGLAGRLPRRALVEACQASAAVRSVLERYAEDRFRETMIRAACATVHPLRARLSSLLLSLADRLGDNCRLTHATLAALLNARRPTVTLVVRSLQNALVQDRARLRIADRKALLSHACRCYRLLRPYPGEAR